jgi:outer membrane protein assembly factor BamB
MDMTKNRGKLKRRAAQLRRALIDRVLATAPDAGDAAVVRDFRDTHGHLRSELERGRRRVADILQAQGEFAPLEQAQRAAQREVRTAELRLSRLRRPLGKAAFATFLAGQVQEQALFSIRMALHVAIAELQQRQESLTPPPDARFLARAGSRLRQLAVFGQRRVAELKARRLETEIGTQLLDSGQEESVRAEGTASVLGQVSTARALLAQRRQQLADAAAAVEVKRVQWAQALALPPFDSPAILADELSHCRQQIGQWEGALAALEQALPDRLVAEPAAAADDMVHRLAAELGQIESGLREQRASRRGLFGVSAGWSQLSGTQKTVRLAGVLTAVLVIAAACVFSPLGRVLWRTGADPAFPSGANPGPATASSEEEVAQTIDAAAPPTATSPAVPDKPAAPPKPAGGQSDQSAVNQPPTGPSSAPVSPAPAPGAPAAAAWYDALLAETPPRNGTQGVFDSFAVPSAWLQPDDLKKWFAAVPGQSLSIKSVKVQEGASAQFDGPMRLNVPWRAEVALRMGLADCTRLQLHCYRGEHGVTLAYYPSDNDRWAAYTTQRRPGQVRPETYVLAATDEDRARRTEFRHGGTVELGWHDGELLLIRGDVVLLRAPLAQPPEEVYLDGHAALRGLVPVTGAAFPPREPAAPVARDIDRPADLPWTLHVSPGARWEQLPDGAVQLAAEAPERDSWATTPVPQAGLHELVVEVDGATPGTAVFLANETRQPREMLRFVRDTRSGKTCVVLREDNTQEHAFHAVQERLVPFASPRQWFRMVFGAGTLRWWVSADGVHWAAPELPRAYLPPDATHLGLHCLRGKGRYEIRLRRIQLRSLPALAALAPAELVERAAPLQQAPHIGAWLAQVATLRPEGTDPDAWRRACAIRSLGAGCGRDLGNRLVESLLDDAARRGLTLVEQRDLLREAALLLDTVDDGTLLDGLSQRYRRLGLAAFEQQGERPYSWVRQAAMTAPVASRNPLAAAWEDVIRAELIQLIDGRRWAEAAEFCHQLRFFRLRERTPLLGWAETVTARSLPGSVVPGHARPRSAGWSEPLIQEVSREVFNATAELKAMLDGGSFPEAAQFIAALDAGLLRGVAPDASDRALLVSLRAAVHGFLAASPPLATELKTRFGEAARLRVRQAIRDGDVPAIELATVQFAGTPAAADAYQWLGDRALSGGWFAAALACYREAHRALPAMFRGEVVPRARLANALSGRQTSGGGAASVRLGEMEFSAAEFEALLAQPAAPPASQLSYEPLALPPLEPLPAPTRWDVQRRSTLDGLVGKETASDVIPQVRRFAVDWPGRQLAAVRERDLLYVSNRFQVAAYDLSNGQRKWQTQPPHPEPLRSQDWGLTKMRPLLTATRVFVRMLYDRGPMLVCLDKATGQVLWNTDSNGPQQVVSDPFVAEGQLLAMTVAKLFEGEHGLQLAVWDAETGQLVRKHDLIRLNDAWWRRPCCEVVQLEDLLIAVLGGLTLACDYDGHVLWIRKHAAMPPDEEPGWVTQESARPLAVGRDVIVAQPGVRSLQRLHADDGGLLWTLPLPGVQRILGIADQRVLVQTDEGVIAIEAATGRRLWSHANTGLLEGSLCGSDGVLYARRAPLADRPNAFRPALVWLEAATGRAKAEVPLDGLDHEEPRLGPMLVRNGRIWTWYGCGFSEATRTLLELVPNAAQPVAGPLPEAGDVWTRHIPERLHRGVARLFHGWRLLCCEPAAELAVEQNRWGQNDVLVTRSRPGTPIVLTRQIAVPPEGRATLRITVGNEPSQQWKLTVRLDSRPALVKEITPTAHAQPWKTIDVDLCSVAGYSGWLIVEAQHLQGGDYAELCWKELAVAL